MFGGGWALGACRNKKTLYLAVHICVLIMAFADLSGGILDTRNCW